MTRIRRAASACVPTLLLATCLTTSAAFADEPAATDGAPSLVELALRAGGSLLLVLALFAGLVILFRRFRSIGSTGTVGDQRLLSRARLDLGGRREIRLVQVEDRLLVVGVTGDGMNLLAELPASSAAPASAEPQGGKVLASLRRLTTSS